MTPDFSPLAPGDITASLVVDVEGRSVSAQGNSRGIGNETDLALLRWLRSRSQVILTSGKTAEVDNYRLPSVAKLAILSNQGRTYPRLQEHLDDVLFIRDAGYLEAIENLQEMGYERIHTEFGESGFCVVVESGADCFVSSVHESGVLSFAQRLNMQVEKMHHFGDLFVAQVVGRGSA